MWTREIAYLRFTREADFCLRQTRKTRLWTHHFITAVLSQSEIPSSFPCAGEGAGRGHHLCAEGHQEEARRGQQAGGAHPLGKEDPRRGSLALCRQVSPPSSAAKNISIFYPAWWSSAPLVWGSSVALISFWWDHSWGLEQITSSRWGRKAGDIEMRATKMELFVMKYGSRSFSLLFVRLRWSNFTVCSGTGSDIKAILHHLRGSSRRPPHHRCIYLTFFRRFYDHLFIFLICFQDLHKGI